MPTYGRNVLSETGIPVMALALLDGAKWKVGGITIDWALITAVVSATTLNDGTIIPAAQKGMEYGTILCMKTVQEIQTLQVDATGGDFIVNGNALPTAALAFNASAAVVQAALRGLGGAYASVTVAKVQNRWTLTHTSGTDGGTFALRVTRNGVTRQTVALAWDAAAATLDAALEALDVVGTAGVAVTGSAGGPYTLVFAPTLGDIELEVSNDLTADGGVIEGGVVAENLAGGAYVVTFPAGSGNVTALTTTAAGLTGGAQTATVATATGGDATGTFGPYDSAATDGRQNLVRGQCFVLNETVLQTAAGGLSGPASDHPAVFSGGTVWKDRLKVGGQNPTYLGAGTQPSWAAFEAAFPQIDYV